MRQTLAIADTLSRWLAWLAMGFILALIATMFYEVLMRYAFNAPTVWSHDVSYMLNGSIFLLGAGFTLSKNLHVRIDFLSVLLPLRWQHAVNLAVYLGLLVPALVWIGYRAWDEAWTAFITDEVEVVSPWAPLIWPFELAIALGVMGLGVQAMAHIVRHAIGCVDPDQVPAPSDQDRH